MAYFNGSGGYHYLGKYAPLVEMTRIYCDDCAEAAIPFRPLEHGPPAPGDSVFGGIESRNSCRHFGTEFRWTPCYGRGAVCDVCGKKV